MKIGITFEYPAKSKILIYQELFMIGLSERYGRDPWLMDFGPTYPMMTFDHIFCALPYYRSCLWSRSWWPNYINYYFIFIAYSCDIVIVNVNVCQWKLASNFEFPAKIKMLIPQELLIIGLSESYGVILVQMMVGGWHIAVVTSPVRAGVGL